MMILNSLKLEIMYKFFLNQQNEVSVHLSGVCHFVGVVINIKTNSLKVILWPHVRLCVGNSYLMYFLKYKVYTYN